jgi:hypothetical protein
VIIHFWELPKTRNYIILKDRFKQDILKKIKNKDSSNEIVNKLKTGKVSIQKIKILSKKKNISLSLIEQNILWIGGNNSKGLSNPKFPINLSTRNASRFIAAIINDGTLTKEGKNSRGRLMYDNFDESLRSSVLKDCLIVFGGKREEIAFRNTKKKKYLEFSSVLRDIVYLILKNKGPKCETNLPLPDFVFENKESMCGWIEQTIADEGEVKYYPDKYRRSIIWRRSLDITPLIRFRVTKDIPLRRLSKKIQNKVQNQRCNLISNEEKILRLLGIGYTLYNLGIYPTAKNKVRTRWQISITKRRNLLKLRDLIKIPSESKDRKFNLITKEYARYKEPLAIRSAVINLGKGGKPFTSLDLKKMMDYKETNTSIKWLKLFEKEGLIKKIKESSYGGGSYRKPAEYEITPNR